MSGSKCQLLASFLIPQCSKSLTYFDMTPKMSCSPMLVHVCILISGKVLAFTFRFNVFWIISIFHRQTIVAQDCSVFILLHNPRLSLLTATNSFYLLWSYRAAEDTDTVFKIAVMTYASLCIMVVTKHLTIIFCSVS